MVRRHLREKQFYWSEGSGSFGFSSAGAGAVVLGSGLPAAASRREGRVGGGGMFGAPAIISAFRSPPGRLAFLSRRAPWSSFPDGLHVLVAGPDVV